MLTVEKVSLLKRVSIFEALPDDLLGGVAARLQEQQVAAGTPIIVEGQSGTTMYVIAGGEVRVHSGQALIARLGPKDVFGELSALDPEPRSASVTAETDVSLLLLEHDELFELMNERVEVALGIIRFLCRRYRPRAAEA